MKSYWVKNLLSFSSKKHLIAGGHSNRIGNGWVRVCKYNRPRSLCHLISPICTRVAANDNAILASHALLSYYSDLCPFQRSFPPCLLAMRLQLRKPNPWVGILAHASSLHALIPLASSEWYVALPRNWMNLDLHRIKQPSFGEICTKIELCKTVILYGLLNMFPTQHSPSDHQHFLANYSKDNKSKHL